jgi:hypothetical protein
MIWRNALDFALRISSVSCLALAGLHYVAWIAVSRKLRDARARLARAIVRVERALPPLRHSLTPEDERMRALRIDLEAWARLPALPNMRELETFFITLPSSAHTELQDDTKAIDDYLDAVNEARAYITARKMPLAQYSHTLAPFELALISALLYVSANVFV